MRILVTGSEGNVGSVLVPYLRVKGHTIFRCDQVQGHDDDYMVTNILSSAELARAFNEFSPEVVFHLAAMVSRLSCEASPNLTIDTNLSGLNNVIQLCKQFRSKLIYFSTSEVYGNIDGLMSEDRICEPNNIYGLSKYLGEQLVNYELSNGLKSIIVRPTMLYREGQKTGSNRSAIIQFVNNLIGKNKITVHTDSQRAWLHLDDAVRIFEKLIYVNKFKIINIGNSQQITTKKLAEIICDKLGLDYSEYVINSPLPPRMTLKKIPDLSKQESFIDFKFISIYEGIERVINAAK